MVTKADDPNASEGSSSHKAKPVKPRKGLSVAPTGTGGVKGIESPNEATGLRGVTDQIAHVGLRGVGDRTRITDLDIGQVTGLTAAMAALKPSTSITEILNASNPLMKGTRYVDDVLGLGTLDPTVNNLGSVLGSSATAPLIPSLATLLGTSQAHSASKIAAASALNSGYSELLSAATAALSIRDWESALNASLAGKRWPTPRARRKPADFFSSFEVEVASLKQLLKALSVLQQKNSGLGLVWRGQRNAEWAVDSSLTRALRKAKHQLDEERLIAVERFQLAVKRVLMGPQPLQKRGSLDPTDSGSVR